MKPQIESEMTQSKISKSGEIFKLNVALGKVYIAGCDKAERGHGI
jgi:hypothetical protein